MKTSLPIVFFLLLSMASFGQSKYERGYYVTFQGDSVSSYIKNEDWIRNPEAIEVKSSPESSAVEKLTLKQVQRFGFENGDKYETFALNVDASPTDFDQLVINASPITVRDTVMLRALVTGPADFYVYTDKNARTHYYIGKANGEPRELLAQNVKRNINNKVSYKTLELYKGMLQVYMADCEAVSKKISQTPFRQSALAQLVREYNACTQPGSVQTDEKSDGSRFRFGVVAGFSSFALDFSSSKSSFDELVNSEFKDRNFLAGLAFNYTVARGHGRWTIVNELMLKPYAVEAHYESSESASISNVYDTKFKFLYLGVNSLVRYAFATGAVRPFVNLGMANNFILSENSEQQHVRNFYSSERTYTGKPMDEIRKYEQALLIGAGAYTNKFAVEARLEQGNGMSPYTYLKSTKTAYSLQLTYFLR